ncbi:transcriptional regulator [Mycolicibacterium peregrinum]|uniref:PucR family transcriptional regulator n=1 Tax=Mycolicibacterium peregrinum TaxID=43304 RepID=UPI0006D83D4C|nr:helix-turn-helix domain-containing protein [Mycolicibacterium peregrinum]MCV7203893.1 helix-turn-helix domain-containing protein [Mycolicibacterium peregrinum]ORW58247.1 transcriptional regulator [Mycolicibacterium peregrinum]OWM00261.1 transcriptional regulator [Mycolicibacterium peregrinum]
MRTTGVSLGQLLLALDATLVRLVEAPRGLDLAVASAALIDSDDVRLGLAPSAGAADVFFLLGVSEADALGWVEQQTARRAPAAIFIKKPSDAVIERAVAAGTAVVAVDPRARWERLYRLVNHVFEHHGDGALHDSGTDLFGLAQSVAERTHGMVSIEDAQSHVLAYSASSDEADELRRLSILGRAGPPEHLAWIAQWGIFDALRSRPEAVRVAERPELGLRPRLAIGIFAPAVDERRAAAFVGTIWVQQGSRPLAEDAEEVMRGAAVLAARIMARLAAAPSTHAVRVQELLGLGEAEAHVEVESIARELGVAVDGRAAVIGFDSRAGANQASRMADVLALSASAFRHDAQMASVGSRVYVLFPSTGKAVTSWVRGTVASLRSELGLELHAVIASPVAGLAGAAAARTDVDRVLDTAQRHPGTLAAVTSLAEARTTVLLDEIVTAIAADERLIDPRVRMLRADEPVLAETLGVYLDCFGDVAAAAQHLHVHPNTVRYRIRRVEQLIAASLNDAEVRLLLALSLRATA